MIPFEPKGPSRAMTAAERQRRCRANGKGKHRGPSLSMKQYREQAQRIAAAQALAASSVALSALPQPTVETPSIELNLSAMAA